MSWMSTVAAAALLAGTFGATAQVPAEQKQESGNSATKTLPDAGAAKPQSQRPPAAQNGGSGAAPGSSAERAKPSEQDTGIKSAQGEKPGGDQPRSTTQKEEKSQPSTASRSKDSKESKDSAQSRDGDKQRANQNRDRDNQRASDRDRDNQRASDRDRDNQRAGDRDRDRDSQRVRSRDRDQNDQRAGSRDRDDRGERRDRANDDSGRKGERVQFSERERTKIRESVNIERARVNVNIDVNVGAVIPRTVELYPLPAAIIEINPRYRNYRYVVVRDEIVIINPQTYAVVEVIPAGGSTQARASTTRRGGSVQLNTQQRARILTYAQAECATVLSTDPDFDLAVGIRVPERIELCPFEDVVAREVGVVQPYRFFVVRDQVVLVDPADHTIVEVIR
jgi:hypothetical protein